ncbi:MAG: membrane protein insertase YidC [Treponema sp.]|jgi:YidC/Oxa1 family membrane protein insertase|nr:membrane protein insertase YidC [Treponema sp.]
MEKNTIIAVVLSVVVITAYTFIQAKFFPVEAPASPPAVEAPQAAPAAGAESPALPQSPPPALPGPDAAARAADAGPRQEEHVIIDTPLLRVDLTNAGGDVVSFKLKEHRDSDDYVEMVLSPLQYGDAAAPAAHAFSIAFGNLNTRPVDSLFYVNRISDYAVEFYRDGFTDNAGNRFGLKKRYTFKPDEYMFELAVSLEGDYATPALNMNGAAYTLVFGPQIGPRFEKLDGRYDYRQYITYANGKRKEEKVKDANTPAILNSRVSWAAIAGKYFAFIAIPDATQYEIAFSTRPEPGLPSASRFYMSRPALAASHTTDTYRFYLGPKSQKNLAIYDTGVNSFNLREMDLSRAASSSGILSPVETALKWSLNLFYRLIPNYGVAIILLTLLVKLLLFPLTKKSSESTLRMQTLAPKIKELQEKYKDSPQQMNAKMAELYKQEGTNPMSGCLPLLIQFPIFIAMYNLFNNHFDLRGAPFIPGWIPDLSVPESVFSFAPHRIPILGWSDIRLLPFIYVGSQLLTGKITQTPDQQGNSQMKMMLYVMPIMFFFILYNVPSGLTVYWIMTNFLSLIQQLIINKYLKQKRAAMATVEKPAPVIVPPKARKRRK